MNNELISKVFRWFGLGLLVTFLVAYLVSMNVGMLTFVFSGFNYLFIAILEIVCAMWLQFRIFRMSKTNAIILYIGYAALTGLTFSSIFVVYEISSIMFVFLATAIVFGLFSIIGKRINVDLRKFGIYLALALISIIVLEIINIFIMNSTLDLFLCSFTILVFVFYVAYDIHRIFRINVDNDNLAIIGAFNLYLDFINIFIQLLRLFGRDRN